MMKKDIEGINTSQLEISYDTLWKSIIRPPKDEYDLAIVAVSHNCISEVRFNAKITINLEEFI